MTTTTDVFNAATALSLATDLIQCMGWVNPELALSQGELLFQIPLTDAGLTARLHSIDTFAFAIDATVDTEPYTTPINGYWGRVLTRGGNAAGVPVTGYFLLTTTQAHELGLVTCEFCSHPSHDDESQCLAGVWVDGLEDTICGCKGADDVLVVTGPETPAEALEADRRIDCAADAL